MHRLPPSSNSDNSSLPPPEARLRDRSRAISPPPTSSTVDERQRRWHLLTSAVADLCGADAPDVRATLTAAGMNPHPRIAGLFSHA
ncbi:MAG: hypothetical protein R3C10_03995 [Pirellulales bacterium]